MAVGDRDEIKLMEGLSVQAAALRLHVRTCDGQVRENAAVRLMLDTNLWSYLGDEGSAHLFDAEVRRRNIQVVVAPSTLIEVARIPKPDVRQRIIRVLATGPRHRLQTEACLEGMEVVSEARRLRPQWLRKIPDVGRVASLNTWWTKTVWRRALDDSQWLHEYELKRLPLRDLLVAEQREVKSKIAQDKFNIRPLTAITAEPAAGTGAELPDGWDGLPVEAWRLTSWNLYWYQLSVVSSRAIVTGEDTTVADWVGSHLDLSRIRPDQASFLQFWTREVQLNRMPRNWLRWAVNAMQTSKKITPGNPADEQHSAYLLDCDLFLTADSSYAEVLKEVRHDAPFFFAEIRAVDGDFTISIIDRIMAKL